jgi:hypothetical protein
VSGRDTRCGTHCGDHSGIPEDLRVTAMALLDRLRAATETMIAVVRGERSELVTRLADHAGGLLAVLVAVLEEAAPPARQEPRRPHGGGRSVQRIVVHRT